MTRKIEDQMIAAIRAGKDWQSGNTRVSQSVGACQVFLHDNLIAECGHATNGTRWTLAGWNTTTTRSRINALARAFNWRGVRTVKGQPVISTTLAPISDTEWVDALA